MPHEPVLALAELNFLLIGLLPILFFRRDGRHTAMWWATAAPFFLCPAYLMASHFGIVSLPTVEFAWLPLAAVPFFVGSIVLIGMATAVHRIPISLWHQSNDAPAGIVTWGPYHRIRHPLYTAFLLTFAGVVMLRPDPMTWIFFKAALVLLTWTAVREEKKLLASEHGVTYRAYMERTGRFLPR